MPSDAEFQATWRQVKHQNKEDLAAYILELPRHRGRPRLDL